MPFGYVRSVRHAPLLAVTLFGLSACATLDQPDTVSQPPLAWAERQQYLAGLESWKMSGRVAVQTKEDSWSATIRWNQMPARYAINLSGPLGGNAMTIQGGPGYVVMQTSDGEKYSETNPDRLIEAQTGWQIPVAGLRYWAMGLVAPQSPAAQAFDAQGRVSELRQSGWTIQYQRYQRKNQTEMPDKIQLENERFKVKLVVKDWQLGPPRS